MVLGLEPAFSEAHASGTLLYSRVAAAITIAASTTEACTKVWVLVLHQWNRWSKSRCRQGLSDLVIALPEIGDALARCLTWELASSDWELQCAHR